MFTCQGTNFEMLRREKSTEAARASEFNRNKLINKDEAEESTLKHSVA